MPEPQPIGSVCLFCGSSDDADPEFLQAAADLGRLLAGAGVKLVYGGGGVGLMGAAARACHEAGGQVLGIMPDFLRKREMLLDEVETVVVRSMHQRKTMMYDASDAYVVLPGGIGTLEEIVEVLSWRRLELHIKPIVFVNLKGFWAPFYDLIAHTVTQKLTPAWTATVWRSVDRIEDVLPALAGVEADLAKVKQSA
jgi:uncharacterized protein (TIGR00730 family)